MHTLPREKKNKSSEENKEEERKVPELSQSDSGSNGKQHQP